MPTSWVSSFSGNTWTRTTNPDGSAGEWYLHLFTPEQPDLNWDNPQVWAEHEDILRFWFDRGVAGVRIDSAALPVKDPALPEIPEQYEPGQHPHLDRDALHEVYRGWERSLTPTRGPGCWSARSGWRTANASRSTCAHTRCTPRSTSASCPGPGKPRNCALLSIRPWRHTRRSVPRQPGCSPTMT